MRFLFWFLSLFGSKRKVIPQLSLPVIQKDVETFRPLDQFDIDVLASLNDFDDKTKDYDREIEEKKAFTKIFKVLITKSNHPSGNDLDIRDTDTGLTPGAREYFISKLYRLLRAHSVGVNVFQDYPGGLIVSNDDFRKYLNKLKAAKTEQSISPESMGPYR